ncbi:MAG: hypothetical protein LBQ24_03745 [Candidatus Peribacteria bacterium]|jgi:hypothetical protein|nr:hypothetical protein [Candidatus Peribacteria bacterium]
MSKENEKIVKKSSSAGRFGYTLKSKIINPFPSITIRNAKTPIPNITVRNV